MSGVWEKIQTVRRSCSFNIVIGAFLVIWGIYTMSGSFQDFQDSLFTTIYGIFFLAIGLLTLYNQLQGEPITETIRSRL